MAEMADMGHRVRFPPGAEIEGASMYVYNEVVADVAPDRVWAWLVRAALWPEWYRGCRNIDIEGGGPDLAPGTRFHWTTLGVRVHTRIDEWIPGERLAWSGTGGGGATGYHGWVIERRPEGDLRIVTEETQRGLLPRFGRWYFRPKLLHLHQQWLENLVARARAGLPGPR